MQICCFHDVNSISALSKHGTCQENVTLTRRERHFDQARTSLQPGENVTPTRRERHSVQGSMSSGQLLHGARPFSARRRKISCTASPGGVQHNTTGRGSIRHSGVTQTRKKSSRPPVTALKCRCTKTLRHGRCVLKAFVHRGFKGITGGREVFFRFSCPSVTQRHGEFLPKGRQRRQQAYYNNKV